MSDDFKAVRLRLEANYGQLRRASTGRQKSSPLVPLGLHSLFSCLRTIHPAVVFFCHTFCISECRAELVQAMPSVAKYHEVIFAE